MSSRVSLRAWPRESRSVSAFVSRLRLLSPSGSNTGVDVVATDDAADIEGLMERLELTIVEGRPFEGMEESGETGELIRVACSLPRRADSSSSNAHR